MASCDIAIVGGGLVGLATAMQLLEQRPGVRVIVLEREADVGLGQSSRNSGVLHAGLYYTPGSAKARWCTTGKLRMEQFCEENDVPLLRNGKVVAAVQPDELPRLAQLAERARINGVEIRELTAEETHELEPNVTALAGIHSPNTCVTDFGLVAQAMARRIRAAGGEVRTGSEVVSIDQQEHRPVRLNSRTGTIEAAAVVACTGLQADRVARGSGVDLPERILPFRGSWLRLKPEKRHLISANIYPVPAPGLPFLGVHLTPRVSGEVWIGPNAVLALAREGRRPWSIDVRDLSASLGFAGLWRLARQHPSVAFGEVFRDLWLRATIREVQRYVPEIGIGDVERGPWGVRAQLTHRDGGLVDDFRFERQGRVLHVLNAPSPAATSSLMIGDELAGMVAEAL
jgi:(S)-2-hydroxyglutarate dehydrogenase